VLGSILGALKGIVNVIGMTRMTPPIKELLPRLTPILKNRCATWAPLTAGPALPAGAGLARGLCLPLCGPLGCMPAWLVSPHHSPAPAHVPTHP
jgi:hypothetical protein